MAVDITLRSVKGAPLTIPEVDTNFTNLKDGIDGQAAAIDAAVAAVNGMDARVDALEATTNDQGNRIVALETGGGGGGGSFGSNDFFSGSKNATQNFPVNTSVYSIKVSYNLEGVDGGSGYDPAGSTFTAPATGWYYFVASIRLDMATSTTAEGINSAIFFYRNGGSPFSVSENHLSAETDASGHTMLASGATALNAGDTVEVRFSSVCFSGGLTWNLTAGGEKSYFQGWRVA